MTSSHLGVMGVLVSALVLLLQKTVSAQDNTNMTGSLPETEAQIVSVRYLSDDERAALWACFLGGLMAIAGVGFLYHDFKLKKYEQPFPYPRKKKPQRTKSPVSVGYSSTENETSFIPL